MAEGRTDLASWVYSTRIPNIIKHVSLSRYWADRRQQFEDKNEYLDKISNVFFYETERLYFRPFFFTDVDDFRELASDPWKSSIYFPTQASIDESQYALAKLLYEVT